jgi:type I restriction enzyme S subunit
MIPESWQAKKLHELGFVGRGRSRHRPRNDPKLYGGDYPFVQTGDVKAAEFWITEYSQTYNEEGLKQSKIWDKGTLCITIAANIAETSVLGINACFPDSIVGFVPDEDKADVAFIKYYIDLIKMQMQSISQGTTQDNLSLEKLETFDFIVPDVKLQRKIASILLAYDDLIENNRQRIDALEAAAQALYREWFVEMRFPGWQDVEWMEAVSSPINRPVQIPTEWDYKNIYEIAEITMGFPFKSKAFTEEPISPPVIRIRNILDNYSDTYTPEEPDSKYIVEDGDLLVGMDGDFHMGKWSGGIAYLNQRVARFRPSAGILSLSYYYLFLALKEPIQYFNATISGTTVAHLGQKHIKTIQVLVPDDKMRALMFEYLDPIFEQELNLRRRNTALCQTRDLLLPRLISGEVSVEGLALPGDEIEQGDMQ